MVKLSKSDTLLRSKTALFVVVGSILVAKVAQSRERKNRWTGTGLEHLQGLTHLDRLLGAIRLRDAF